jgi:hypothetical protein
MTHALLVGIMVLAGAGGDAGPSTAAAAPTAVAPLHPESPEREAFRTQIRGLLQRGEFDELERIAQSLTSDDPRFSSGVSKLVDLYTAFEPTRGVGPDGPDARTAAFTAWAKEKPSSHWPKVGLSVVEALRAATARGPALARDVSPDQWNEHDRHAKAAWEWGQKALADGAKDPEIFTHMIGVCRSVNCPREQAARWVAAATAMNPNYDSVYISMANYLLPRWLGSPEEFVAFAEKSSDENKALGNIVYARIATVALLTEGNDLRKTFPGLQWERIQSGLREIDKRYPDSARTYHLLGHFARVFEDHAVAHEALTRLGGGWDADASSYWYSPFVFREARYWATGDAAIHNVPTEPPVKK